MRKKLLSVLLVLSLMLALVPAVSAAGGANFRDVSTDSWAYEDIQYCVDHELMAGVGGGLFEPKTPTTRAQLVQILYRLAGAPEVSGETPFTDLTADWYKTAVLWAYQTGVTSGVGETTFAPDAPVTREQIAVMFLAFADKVLNMRNGGEAADLSAFPDSGRVSSWARDAMADAVSLGLISGVRTDDGTFLCPKSSATREQIATILMGFYSGIDTALRVEDYLKQ